MKKKECPSCAMNIDEKEMVCPICGYEYPADQKGLRWMAILLVIVFVILMIYRLI